MPAMIRTNEYYRKLAEKVLELNPEKDDKKSYHKRVKKNKKKEKDKSD